MSLTIEHNGRELKFREDDETWSCWAMNMKAKSLKALKAKLDKFDGQARRVSAPVIVVDPNWHKAERADIVMIAKPKDWETADYSTMEKTPSVWINKIKGNQTAREKVRLDRCVEPTMDNMTVIDLAAEKYAAAKAMEAEAKKMLEDLPRISVVDLLEKGAVEDDIDD